jgi:WD40 repeat protein
LGEKLYGRERETRELVGRLIAERIVLVHSPSGAGKTSLLQAAVIPRLQERDFNPLPILHVAREARNIKANRYTFSVLTSLEKGLADTERLDDAALASLTLDDYLKQRAERFGSAASQVLVFDQFEEILSVDPTDQTAKVEFFEQLGKALLVRNRWALFAIREDFMGGLAPYERYVPTQLGNRFRLDLLDRVAARQAIQQPARSMSVDFTDAATSKLVDDLSRVQVQQPDGSMTPQPGLYIEPVQLQVVCLQLWDRLPPDTHQIVESDLAQVVDVDTALVNYYADCVTAIAGETQTKERTIREWFDRKLITGRGVRSQVMQEQGSSGGLANQAIQALIKAHIVRAEERRSVTWFELAHDRLIRPILENNTRWYQANLSALQRQADLWNQQARHSDYLLTGEALDQVEEWAQAHPDQVTQVEDDFLSECRQARLQAEREARQQRRIRRLAIGATIASVIALVAFLVALVFFVNATNQSRINDARRLAARSASLRDRHYDLSLLLGVQASRQDDNPEVRGNLLDAIITHPQLGKYLSGHDHYVQSVAYSPDGKLLASGSWDTKIILWDASTGQVTGSPLKGHTSYVQSVAFSPDGTILASGSADHNIILWDVKSRQPIGEPLKAHTGVVQSIAFSPDGKTLASGSVDMTVLLWDVRSRQLIRSPLKGHTAVVRSVAYSPDGKMIASASADKTIRLWDASTGESIGAPLTGQTGSVESVAFSPDGKLLASSSDNTLILWDVSTRKAVGPALTGHTEAVESVAFSPDSKLLASGSHDKSIILWDVATRRPIGEPLSGHTAVVNSVTFSPDGQTLASGSADKTVILWDVNPRPRIGSPLTGHTDVVQSVAYSPDGKLLASASADKTVILWDMESRPPISATLKGHADPVLSVAFSPDGKTLASGSVDRTIILWNVATRQLIGEPFQGHKDPVKSVAFSPDGKTLASGSFDATILLWDVAAHRPLGEPLTGHTGWVTTVTFSPDGKTLASGSADKTVILWDVATRRQIGKPLTGHLAVVESVAFSPNGQVLASSSDDSTIRLTNVSTLGLMGSLATEAIDPISGIAYSPDGKILAASSSDQIVLWDVGVKQPISAPLKGHKEPIQSVAYGRDGKTLASGSADTTIMLWDVDPASWRLRACEIANRNLTKDEWSVYINPDLSSYQATCPNLPVESN